MTMDADLPTQDKIAGWMETFRFYRAPPTPASILAWIKRFKKDHRAVATKVLDNVLVLSEPQIQLGYKEAFERLPGWASNAKDRKGRWFFVGFGGSGESGPAMVRLFREATRLSSDKYKYLFKTVSELPYLKLTAEDHLVFIDDFAGTGSQVTRIWPTIAELVASEAKCHLILTAATNDAKVAIEKDTDLEVDTMIVLGTDYLVFHPGNQSFTDDDRAIIENYCKKATKESPRGFGNLGALLVLSHKTPNNTLPILQANHAGWVGLFPRYLNV